ncbi:MAG: ABC transporter permease [Rhodocyclaceae bacterium]|nr:ABC transporter permease [Rhodocyclaceae bacterium]MBK6553148.1 ABC transporter permease [Rhodocyclaceae bacterium]MBK9311833.1 ABC transporter permease [Rhodocyclaceae bacterium]MBK9956815.1 ABC transporter permease [Rhodocyclaceae bacterium]
MMPVILWSDALFFLLIAVTLGGAGWARRHEHLRASWAMVWASRRARAAAAVLAVFFAIGFVDSLHYRPQLPVEAGKPPAYSVEVLSALDALLTPLRTHTEKTYSAPLATHSFAKETQEAGGRDFPPLKYPGTHLFGTDKVGQDVLYLTLKSIRTGLLIGTLTTLIMLPAAVLLGIVAGYVGGWVDDVIQYLYTTLNSIPGVLLIAAAVLMMQVVIDTHPDWFATAAERADARLLALCAILGITSWTGLCRLLRGETLKLREMEYVQAARAFGVGPLAIMLRHILPNLMHIVLIALVMDFSGLVLAEAVLSYVGIGVDPNTISFGTMINAARLELAREPMVWWSLAAAFVFMFALVLAANLFADAVRDAFDPRAA